MPVWTPFADGSGFLCRLAHGIRVYVGGRGGNFNCFIRPVIGEDEHSSFLLRSKSMKAAKAEALRLVRERCQEIIEATEE